MRQHRDDPARHAALRRQRLDEPLQVEPLAHGLCHPVDDLGGVAAGLPLQLRDERELLDVAARHPLGDDHERVLDRHAELLVGDDSLHLALHRLRGALDDDRERAGEAVARAESRRDHLQRVRQLLGEAVAPVA